MLVNPAVGALVATGHLAKAAVSKLWGKKVPDSMYRQPRPETPSRIQANLTPRNLSDQLAIEQDHRPARERLASQMVVRKKTPDTSEIQKKRAQKVLQNYSHYVDNVAESDGIDQEETADLIENMRQLTDQLNEITSEGELDVPGFQEKESELKQKFNKAFARVFKELKRRMQKGDLDEMERSNYLEQAMYGQEHMNQWMERVQKMFKELTPEEQEKVRVRNLTERKKVYEKAKPKYLEKPSTPTILPRQGGDDAPDPDGHEVLNRRSREAKTLPTRRTGGGREEETDYANQPFGVQPRGGDHLVPFHGDLSKYGVPVDDGGRRTPDALGKRPVLVEESRDVSHRVKKDVRADPGPVPPDPPEGRVAIRGGGYETETHGPNHGQTQLQILYNKDKLTAQLNWLAHHKGEERRGSGSIRDSDFLIERLEELEELEKTGIKREDGSLYVSRRKRSQVKEVHDLLLARQLQPQRQAPVIIPSSGGTSLIPFPVPTAASAQVPQKSKPGIVVKQIVKQTQKLDRARTKKVRFNNKAVIGKLKKQYTAAKTLLQKELMKKKKLEYEAHNNRIKKLPAHKRKAARKKVRVELAKKMKQLKTVVLPLSRLKNTQDIESAIKSLKKIKW
jgi:hypothetical protein